MQKMKISTIKQMIREEIQKTLRESVESNFEDRFALDQSKGGTDNSLNKVHRQLLKIQTQMNELMMMWKDGKIDTKTYITKRKAMQDVRNKLEANLLSA